MFKAWDSQAGCIEQGAATLKCLPVVFNNIVSAALVFAGTVAFFLIIRAGIQFISSGGDPKQAGAARQTLTYALIGLIVILLSFAILNGLSYITGVECISTNNAFGFENCKP